MQRIELGFVILGLSLLMGCGGNLPVKRNPNPNYPRLPPSSETVPDGQSEGGSDHDFNDDDIDLVDDGDSDDDALEPDELSQRLEELFRWQYRSELERLLRSTSDKGLEPYAPELATRYRDREQLVSVAIQFGHVAVLRAVLDEVPGFNWQTFRDSNQNILHLAARFNQRKVVDFVWDELSLDRNALLEALYEANDFGTRYIDGFYTPFLLAVRYGASDTARALLERKPELHKQVLAPGTRNAFHIAAGEGRSEIVKVLIEAFGDESSLKIRDAHKYSTWLGTVNTNSSSMEVSPIELAAIYGNLGFFQVLIDSDIDFVDFRNAYGNTLLHLAAGEAQLELIRLLLDQGADISQKTNRMGNNRSANYTAGLPSSFWETCNTPLHYAAHNRSKSRVSIPIIEVWQFLESQFPDEIEQLYNTCGNESPNGTVHKTPMAIVRGQN